MTANLSTLRHLKAAVLFGVALICSAQITDATKSDPTAYLNRVLDIVQARALNKDQIDWPRLRKEALDRAAGAELTVDTYAAIRFAVGALGDHHSSFHPNPDLEALIARRHPVKPEPSEPDASSPFVGRYEPEGRLVQFDGKTFGLVVVPKCFPESSREFVAFETALQKILKDLSEVGPTGWIVDLRGNVGGNMWPMLAGIGPLLGEGDHLGEFFTTSGHSLWKYRDGVASEIENGKEDRNPSVAGSAYKMTGTPKVAVLIDRRTGSSGEAIGVAFRGRSRTGI